MELWFIARNAAECRLLLLLLFFLLTLSYILKSEAITLHIEEATTRAKQYLQQYSVVFGGIYLNHWCSKTFFTSVIGKCASYK